MNADKKLIGIRIMQRRKDKGLTQEQLAEQLDMSKNHISSIECGKYMPTTKFIMSLCDVLGGTPDYYLVGMPSDTTDKISELISQLPEQKQRIILKLLETYLAEFCSD